MVDDNDDLGTALLHLLNGSDGIACVGHVMDADLMLAAVHAAPRGDHRPDPERPEWDRPGANRPTDQLDSEPQVILCDLTMPGRDPLEAITELKRIAPHIRIIAFSGYDDQAMQLRARQAGADGFLAKQADVEQICQAIRAVVAPSHQ